MGKLGILETEEKCYLSGSSYNIHRHHIYFGSGYRKISEANGFTVHLRADYHNASNRGVHCGNKKLDLFLKKKCQEEFEKTHTREEFMALIGRNYLD